MLIYAGLMIDKGELKVLAFNVRFGDPECQVLMPLLENDILDLLLKASTNRLNEIELKIKDKKSRIKIRMIKVRMVKYEETDQLGSDLHSHT